MHHIFVMTPAGAVDGRVNPRASMLNEELCADNVAEVSMSDEALIVLACDVFGKGDVVGEIVLVEDDDFLFGMPVP